MQSNVFVEIFSRLQDPRLERTRKHLFFDIIGLSIFAVMVEWDVRSRLQTVSANRTEYELFEKDGDWLIKTNTSFQRQFKGSIRRKQLSL